MLTLGTQYQHLKRSKKFFRVLFDTLDKRGIDGGELLKDQFSYPAAKALQDSIYQSNLFIFDEVAEWFGLSTSALRHKIRRGMESKMAA